MISRLISMVLAAGALAAMIYLAAKSLSPDAALPWDVIGALSASALTFFFGWLALPGSQRMNGEQE